MKSYFLPLTLAGIGIMSGCQKQKPNFLFFLVDDLGYMDVGFNNPETFYETPNADRLATEGVRFTQAYAACPVCSPTRASIMTGKYPARLNTTDYFGAPQPEAILKRKSGRFHSLPLLPAHYQDRLPLEEVTLAEALKEAGYATFFAGKWHLGPEGYWPENQGFDVNMGGITRGGPYGGHKYFSPYGNPRLPDGPAGEHLPDRLATEAVKFIQMHEHESWLAYVSFYSVHTPLMAREDLKKKYEQKRIQMWNERKGDSVVWGREGERKVRLVQDHPVYAGMVEAMDQAVGKVLDYIRKSGLEKNTIVFYMSDNGGLSTSEGHPTSNLPLRAGKGWLYEGGIREPMLIKWSGVTTAGTVCDEPVISTDFYPTILEMAGLPLRPNQHVDGISMVPLVLQKERQSSIPAENDTSRAIFWHYPHWGNQGGSPGAAVRRGRYKLIEFFGTVSRGQQMTVAPTRVELYDLQQDISETKNLADSLPDLRNELSQLLHNWQKEVDARFPAPNPDYKKQ